jgi:hypothetical protein
MLKCTTSAVSEAAATAPSRARGRNIPKRMGTNAAEK